jgi:hypothetical protein
MKLFSNTFLKTDMAHNLQSQCQLWPPKHSQSGVYSWDSSQLLIPTRSIARPSLHPSVHLLTPIMGASTCMHTNTGSSKSKHIELGKPTLEDSKNGKVPASRDCTNNVTTTFSPSLLATTHSGHWKTWLGLILALLDLPAVFASKFFANACNCCRWCIDRACLAFSTVHKSPPSTVAVWC